MSDDPSAPEKLDPDLEAKKARHDEAAGLLDEKGVFAFAVRSLRRTWFDDLMASGDVTLVPKLQALDAIPHELMRFVNDYKMAQKRKHG